MRSEHKCGIHPGQPTVIRNDGPEEFIGNEVVKHVFEASGLTLDNLALEDFSDEDRSQFLQLLGVKVSQWQSQGYTQRCQKHPFFSGDKSNDGT